MPTSNVPFAELQRLLVELGFQVADDVTDHYRYEHTASDTVFQFRRYRPQELVNLPNLIMVRRILDERGLLEAHQFDRLLSKTPA
jgi:hypothetical protein